MWPFSKKLRTPVYSVDSQLAMSIKSISLPEATPRWWLFARRDDNWLPDVAIKEGYNASSIVYAAVEKRAKLLASVPWRAELKQGDEWVHQPNSPLQRLVDRPNPDQSWYELIYEASQSLDLAGNAYISEIRPSDNAPPTALWLLPAQYVRIKPGSTVTLVDYYEYDEQGIRARIDQQDMIQLKMPNPNSRWFGMPVLMAAGRAADVDRESGIWQKSSLQNRSVLDVHFQVPEGTTRQQIDELREIYKERVAGPKNARDVMFTSGPVTQLGQTAVEMDFVASRKAVWTEIAAVFGVPLSTLGFTEDVNLANAESMEKQLWQNTAIPQLELIKRQLDHQLAKDFGDNWRLSYDLSGITALQEDYSAKLANAEKLQRMGYTRNEINARLELGFEDDPSGDVRYEPAGMMPSFDLEAPMDDTTKRAIHRLMYG
jgi:HK97 family phage portal protein